MNLKHRLGAAVGLGLTVALSACSDLDRRAVDPAAPSAALSDDLDGALRAVLGRHGFTGRIASTLETRLRRRVDAQLADAGRLLWFDPIQGLNDDNACGGCHAPQNGFGDTQPMAIGIDNNIVVGPARTGPLTQPRSPM